MTASTADEGLIQETPRRQISAHNQKRDRRVPQDQRRARGVWGSLMPLYCPR